MKLSSVILLQIVVPAFVALIVVGLSHLATVTRDRESKRREQRINLF